MKSISVFFNLMKSLAILTVISTLIVACEIPGSQPAISPGLVATTVAMTMQAIAAQASPTSQATPVLPTATALPPTATSAPAPTFTSAPSGVRINFATGATAGIVEGQI